LWVTVKFKLVSALVWSIDSIFDGESKKVASPESNVLQKALCDQQVYVRWTNAKWNRKNRPSPTGQVAVSSWVNSIS
jgi:hypothetical protein